MKVIASALLAAAFAALVEGHAFVIRFNGKLATDENSGMRAMPDAINSPVQDVTSQAIVCNAAIPPPVAPATVAPGSNLTFRWVHENELDTDIIIDSSHKGPCMIYAGPLGSNDTFPAYWTKLWHEGYVGSSWCVDKLIVNRGYMNLTLPANMPAGRYVVRAELLALHAANGLNGAQFFLRCFDINVSGSNSGAGSPQIKFPGAYTATDPGILYNLYSGADPTLYVIPGGAVGSYSGSGSGSGSSTTTTTRTTTTTTVASSPRPSSTTTSSRTTTTTTTTTPTSTNCAVKYGQCGGSGWTGATCCVSSTCTLVNAYYSQCL